MGQKVLIFIIKERDLENTTADKTRDKITSPGKPFSLPPPTPLPTSKSKPLLHSSPLSTPAGASSVSAAGATTLLSNHCLLAQDTLWCQTQRGLSKLIHSTFVERLSVCARCRGCTVREDAAPALAEGNSWSRVGDRINIIDRNTLTEERISSTTHKYLLSAYYGPGTVLRGLSMIIPLLIIQIGSVRRDGSSWKAGRLWLGKAGGGGRRACQQWHL